MNVNTMISPRIALINELLKNYPQFVPYEVNAKDVLDDSDIEILSYTLAGQMYGEAVSCHNISKYDAIHEYARVFIKEALDNFDELKKNV